jgi:hypothetical protein
MRGHGPPRALLTAALLAFAAGACSLSSDVSRELGARCDDLDECDDRCLRGNRFPGGFCSASCDDDDDCPDDAACVDVDGGVCLINCSQAAECEFLGADWTCSAEPSGGGDDEVRVCIGAS